jgi:hypothetical protein
MALVLFESRVNMITVATPSVGGFVVAYDTLGVLTQKDHLGVISPVAGSTPVGSLAQTLAVGSSTGTYSISLGANSTIRSAISGGLLRLDNGTTANIVNLSTDSGLLAQSYLLMNSNSITLRSVNASLSLGLNSAILQRDAANRIEFNSTGCFINLSSSRVLFFTTGTTSTDSSNKASAIVSSRSSGIGTGVSNTVILGGDNITGTNSNSVYVPNLYVKDGGFIKGTSGLGQLKFTNINESFLLSTDKLFGILSSSSSLSSYNGVFMVDTGNTFSTPSTNYGVIYVGSRGATSNSGLSNVVVIGGGALSITQSNTTYIGGSVSIGNKYLLPSNDGTLGQSIQTNGSGSTFWGNQIIQLTISTTEDFKVSDTIDGYSQNGRHIIIDNSGVPISIDIDIPITASYQMVGSGTVSFTAIGSTLEAPRGATISNRYSSASVSYFEDRKIVLVNNV